MTTSVVVVDDEDFTRVTVAAALRSEGIEVAGSYATANDALVHARRTSVDAAVLDLDLGVGPTGIDLAFGLRKLRPGIGIVILTSFSDPRLLTSSVREPPPGSTYLVKQSLTDVSFLSAAVRGSVGRTDSSPAVGDRAPLTWAQVETLRLLAYGLSNAEIGRVRHVTEKSVEQTVTRCAKRLGVVPRAGLNARVSLARAYFALTGPTRHEHDQL